ncbi:hypothetical protein T552_02482 [Pneumocystis carinii B80]|uniref:Matrin-type domain-containing protein n=1 Tax=Pneumocystis carinii (strain B80) TaxID=1408658 RepID=A0A0W4ZF46_PNEC8|nr:hypothetical protein T552_02482 [Pneumocystis carinii B80]KTW26991.1 hypothetical protein T552_02482 [Pneumocystis carinii B80]
MTDVWKSVGNYWCKYCKTFVRNDTFTKKKHEASDRHKGSLKRFIRDLDRKKEKEEKEKKAIQRELDRISGVTGLSTRSIDEVSPKKIAKIPVKKAKSISHKPTTILPVDIKETIGIIGSWEIVQPSEKKEDQNETNDTFPLESISTISTSTVRLKEDYEDLRSFKIKEKSLPLEINEEINEEDTSDLFKKRKFGTNLYDT